MSLAAHLGDAHRLVNIVFRPPNHAPVMCEIQIHYRPILEIKENEAHLFYGAYCSCMCTRMGMTRRPLTCLVWPRPAEMTRAVCGAQ